MHRTRFRLAGSTTGVALLSMIAVTAVAAPDTAGGRSAEHARVVAHWTAERVAAAIPRDLVLDERGQAYLRKPDGALEPYGHTVAATAGSQRPMAKPGGGGDSTAPSISNMDPGAGAVVGAAHTFTATVTDASALRSVTFKVGRPGARLQSFTATAAGNNVYSVSLSGFGDGDWVWNVVAKDAAGNTGTSPTVAFTVDTSGSPGGGNVVANAEYTGAGPIRNAVGRIYFEMPSNSRLTRWAGYVCSGTVVTDGTTGRSVIQTAAHCVYDDAYKAFARNVLFIPNQDGTTGSGTDLDCANDPLGCWSPRFGVVDVEWTTRSFPDNVQWDYAYYVVDDAGAHTGTAANERLDAAVTSIAIDFGAPAVDTANGSAYTTALGYSYSDDPNFMYCAEDLATLDSANWWLGRCGLSGGSSGGPWMQPFDQGTGTGQLISVNSWGYTNQAGMAGPKLDSAVSSASCVFTRARTGEPASSADGAAGIAASCP